MWRIVVHGQPAPKGSLQPFLQWIGGKPVARVREDETAAHKAWRKLVGKAGAGIRQVAGAAMEAGPIRLWVTVTLPRPESVKPEKRWWPWKQSEKHGDADKLARMIGDALADSKVFVNDAQICDLRVIKVYPDTPGPWEKLDHPGAVVRIGPIDDEPVKLIIPVQDDRVFFGHGDEVVAMWNENRSYAYALTPAQASMIARTLEYCARAAERHEDQEVLL